MSKSTYIQCPDGLIVNFEHVVKLRKIDYVLEDGKSTPLVWLKYATGEEERIQFEEREERERFYKALKDVLDIRAL